MKVLKQFRALHIGIIITYTQTLLWIIWSWPGLTEKHINRKYNDWSEFVSVFIQRMISQNSVFIDVEYHDSSQLVSALV